MPRGITPRQPARTGRQESTGSRSGATRKQSVRDKDAPVARRASISRTAISLPRSNPRGQEPCEPSAGTKTISGAATSKPPTLRAAKGHNRVTPERIAEILKRLDQLYPDVTCALTHSSAWELLVATILSAQSTDVNVNRVTPALYRKYPTVEAFAALEPEQLQPDIRSTGFFRNKSKSVVGAARKIVADFGGQVPLNMPDLLTLPGVARKTANVVLGSWFKIAEGVVVDTHVTRISRRLELTTNTDPQKIEQDLMPIIPREKWILFAHQIIWHGRKLCYARKPKCVACPLENICQAADKTWSTVQTHKNAKG